jgi:hypothetical protein
MFSVILQRKYFFISLKRSHRGDAVKTLANSRGRISIWIKCFAAFCSDWFEFPPGKNSDPSLKQNFQFLERKTRCKKFWRNLALDFVWSIGWILNQFFLPIGKVSRAKFYEIENIHETQEAGFLSNEFPHCTSETIEARKKQQACRYISK